jgi:hypothetical protein
MIKKAIFIGWALRALSIFSVAASLAVSVPTSLKGAQAITDANPMRLPQVGDYGLRIITSNLLELTMITTRPAPGSSSDDAVTNWNFVNPANNTLSAPAASSFSVTVGGSQVGIQSIGFKRRPLSAPLYENGQDVYDLRIGNYLYLQLTSPIANNAIVQVSNTDGTLWSSNVMYAATNSPMRITPVIHVNQEGYMPAYGKWAEVGYYLGSMGELSVPSTLGFNIVNVANGQTVYTGSLTTRPEQGYASPAPYQNVLQADFSSVTTVGQYQLQIPTLGASYPFVIDPGIAGLFARTYELGLYHSRCGFSNTLPYTRFTKDACHDLPAAVPDMGSEWNEVNGVLNQMASQFGPGSQLSSTPLLTSVNASLYPFVNTNPVDTHGGHHDAGDYSKYTVDVAQLCHTLLFAVDSLPGVAKLDNLGVPESGDGIPDVLQEALWEIDFLSRLQDSDGGFYFLVYPQQRQYEANVSLVSPNLGDAQCVFPKNTSATAAAVGALAEAGSSPYMKQYYPSNAAVYMAAAVKGYQFLQSAISNHGGRAGSYQAIQQYGNAFTNDDLLAWADASMFAATGNTSYQSDLESYFTPSNPNTVYWGWWRMYEGYGCAIRDYAFAARSGRLQASQLDNNYLTNCVAQILACANDNTNWANHSSYHNSFSDAYKSPFNSGWFFSVNQTFDLAVAAAITNDPAYISAMIGNMNYEAGCNPINMTYVTGIGLKRQQDIVSQYSENSFRKLPPTGIPLGSVQSGFVYLQPYDSVCGELVFPSDAASGSYAGYAPYDRWGDTFNTMTELVSWQQGRSLAAMAYLMGQTSTATQTWQYANATIAGLPATVTNGVPVTVSLSVPGLTLTNAIYTWEATGQDPTTGATFTFTPNTAGANWIEAEAVLPDGRRVFATNAFNAIAVSTPNTYLSTEYAPDSTMVALYHLDNGWTDSTANGLTLTPAGGAYLDQDNVSWMASMTGSSMHAMNLGDTATVTIPNSLIWNANGATRKISIEAMIYVNAYLAYNTENVDILALGNNSDNWDSTLELYDDMYAGPTFRAGANTVTTSGTINSALTPATWHHLGLSIDTNGYTMEVDGTNIATLASGDLANWGQNGNPHVLTLGNFSGWLDEVVVRNITTNAVTSTGTGTSGVNGAPTVGLSIPSGSYLAGAGVLLLANASVTNGSIASVSFFENGVQVGQTLSAGPYSTIWSNVPAGTYSMTAQAISTTGASAISGPVTLLVSPTAPVISPGGGTYTNSATVTLASSSGTTIFYTTDGSTPTANSKVYLAPLTLATNATLNAYAAVGTVAGPISKAQFTIVRQSGGALPSPWTNSDIGAVGVTGGAAYANGIFTVQGGGADIWSTADAFQYAYQPLNGDGQIIAQVSNLQQTDPWAKAGVMFRQSLDANSAQAITLISAANGAAFQDRTSAGGYAVEPNAIPNVFTPYWLKMTRTGSVLNGYVSTDGVNWSLIGSTTIALNSTAYVGLAVTAHTTTPELCAATFSNVQVSSAANTQIAGTVINSSKALTVSFTGLPNYTYYIQATGNLNSRSSWQTVATNTADANGLLQYTEPNSSVYQSRFYRTALPPQ